MDQSNFVVIMAGGIGSRFWPMSRSNYPKQFHDILGTGKSLLQQTAHRFRNICPETNIFVVTNRDYYSLVKQQLPFLSDEQILLEPVGRNTAPCVAYSCFKIYNRDPEANIVVAPSDHVILDEPKFEATIFKALALTKGNDILLTLGITPSRPDTGYGYIQYLEGESDAKKVKTFTEKPNLELAKTFLESGDFVWNSGLFIWSGRAILSEMEKHMLETWEIFEEGHSHYDTAKEREFINTAYTQCKSISIDYGVMEKSDRVYTLLSEFGWSDLGTWKSLYDLSDKDADGNVVNANTLLYDTKDCIIKSTGGKDKLIVVQGLEDYIVAESQDVIMVCRKDDEQKVRDFVADAKLKKDKKFS